MAQQVKIAGALFQDVPSISVPDANDVWHAFTDTSDADAVAADLALGRTAYAGGVKLVGTLAPVEVEPLSVTANGVYSAPTGHAYDPVTVNVEGGGGGGGGDMSDPIRFFDYDGALVASYSVADALALTEMPANPSHAGLVAQGWNYSLADMKSQVQGSGTCDIGQMYITDDGKTRIYLDMPEGMESLYLGIAPKGTVIVDWGDGTATDTLTGTSVSTIVSAQHTYAQAGEHVITLECTSGTFNIFGYVSGSNEYPSALIRRVSSYTVQYQNDGYANMVAKIELGSGVCATTHAFSLMRRLKSITIPSGYTIAGQRTFEGCTSLAAVMIPSGVSSIGEYAFSQCKSIEYVSIPASVTAINSYAFYYCQSIERIPIPIHVTSIGDYAFNSCSTLKSAVIPSGVTNISSSMFGNCSTIRSISLPSSVKYIRNSAFSTCYCLTDVSIPDGVTSIGNSVFANCYALSHVKLPNGITTIDTNAVTSCYSLQSINIPDSVTNIRNNAFSSCRSLTSITIPSSVTSIGGAVFSVASSLKSVHLQRATPPTLGTNAFNNTPSDCVMYVPYSADHSILDAYKTASNWSTYASRMVEEPQS